LDPMIHSNVVEDHKPSPNNLSVNEKFIHDICIITIHY
jgi:hypothetical protein